MKEIYNSKEMRRFEKGHFLKENSYFFMQKAGKLVFEFIKKNFRNKKKQLFYVVLVTMAEMGLL